MEDMNGRIVHILHLNGGSLAPVELMNEVTVHILPK